MTFFFIFIFGLIIGSFLSAITWRIPRGVDFINDRSKCDDCGATIHWYDNIPLFSYIFLRGKCRNCGKKISIRYPLIEFSTSITFVLIYRFFLDCLSFIHIQQDQTVICTYVGSLGYLSLPYLLLVAGVMIAVFITDIEYKIIPDEFVFLLFGLNLIVFPFFFPESFYMRFFSGFLVSLFLLLLHIFTKGRGMGLGDVKLALFAGSFLGLTNSISWIFLSFVIGALVGLLLIFFGKAAFGRQIAFGPFLVICFFLILFWGDDISFILIPYLR